MRPRHATLRIRRALALSLAPVLLLAAAGARAVHFEVNSANDADDALCDASHCSLREAIHAANASPGPDLVTFDLASGIQPGSELPVLTDDGTVIRGDGNVVVNGSQAGGAHGLVLESSHNRIQGLVLRDFGGNGVLVRGHVTTGPADENTIGTDGDGAGDALERNFIHSNGLSGVRIEGPKSSGNVVAGNWIGTSVTGDEARPNGTHGVSLFGSDANRIGTDGDGTSDDLEGNVVAASHGVGIAMDSSFNSVAGNIVGFGADGVVPLGNDYDGISVYFAEDNTIGPDNLVGNNGGNGVALGAARGNRVIGNRIGVDAEGAPAGNGFNGVRIFAVSGFPAIGNQVGVSVGFAKETLTPVVKPLGNVIAHSAWNGIWIDSNTEGFLATNNPLMFNSIYGNELMGIDLVANSCSFGCTDGVTQNDAGDGDGGGNDALNFPEIQGASASSTHTYVLAQIVQGLPDTRFTLQFFANPECDPYYGTGEGEVYLGQVRGMTDAAGNLSAFAALPVPAPVGWVVTSTATELGFLGRLPVNTSEFSPCAELLAARFEHLADVAFELLDALLEEGRVGEQDARALAARAEKILRHADRGRARVAARQLRRLERQVVALERSGQLPSEAALRLLAGGHAAIQELPSARADDSAGEGWSGAGN